MSISTSNVYTNKNSSIKPIDTVWKNYRFRSRLEARWAVFFDELCIKFEYEPQGFELRDGTKYLPDFYLPNQNTYVEIKPYINYKSHKIYMAGKIENPISDWRLNIYPHYPEPHYDLPGFHTYVGPYPMYENSNDLQVKYTHGLYSKKIINESNHDINQNVIYQSTDNFYPDMIVQKCLDGINQCDILFAWINSMDCFGTIAEIGYAKASGKKVFVGLYEDLEVPVSKFTDYSRPHNICESHDLWFIEWMSDRFIRSWSPRHAFEQFFVQLPEQFNKIRQFDEGILISGNPYPGEYSVYQNWKRGCFEFLNNTLKISDEKENLPVLSALSKARSARFEHGE